MTLNIEMGWDNQILVATAENIQITIADAATRYANAYVIIDKGLQVYMQSYHEPEGFILEKREGSAEKHFRAMSHFPTPSTTEFPELWERLVKIGPMRNRYFEADEIIAAFCAYVENKPVSASIEWQAFKV